ncbi:MAG: hypothetical protein QXR60_01240 [Candidatus Nanoarchaeia archaeon]
MNYIKKIFENKIDETVHQKLVRYGKGEYESAIMEVKNGNTIKVKATFDFSNDLFGTIAENIKEEAEVNGSVIAARDFEKEFDFLDYKKKKGANIGEIKAKLKPEQIKELYEKFKTNFILLNLKSKDFSLSVGKTLPKPGGKIKEDFCKATLPKELLNEFVWETKEFSNAKIRHTFMINELIVPKEYENDYAKARIMAKRKGKIKRIIELDRKKIEKEAEFTA